MIRRSILCSFAACLVTSCDLPSKPAVTEPSPAPVVQKTETPVEPVTPVVPRRDSGMKSPDDLNRLPTREDFVPATEPQNPNGAAIHVPPPTEPKPAESKPQ